MGNLYIEEVWYEGTDALKQGEAVCYNTDYGTATAFDGRRCNRVERPSLGNNMAFAGVVERDYSAKSAGQRVRICVPGSKGALIALGANATMGDMLTFTAGASGSHRGRFVKAGFKGRGSAVIRQTDASAILETDLANGWSLATDGVTLTVSSTTGLAAGDFVALVAGEAEDGGGSIVPGVYTISSITDSTVLVLTATAISGTAGAALDCSGFAYNGNPKVQADLLTGEESGGVEFISLPNAGGDDQTYMVGGVSYVGGVSTLAADAECELADGTFLGERKAFIALGTIGTSDFVVDLVTAGVQFDGSALAEVNAIDAANDAVVLEWWGIWCTIGLVGGATQA
jgi:hypothetical protein